MQVASFAHCFKWQGIRVDISTIYLVTVLGYTLQILKVLTITLNSDDKGSNLENGHSNCRCRRIAELHHRSVDRMDCCMKKNYSGMSENCMLGITAFNCDKNGWKKIPPGRISALVRHQHNINGVPCTAIRDQEKPIPQRTLAVWN